MRISDWSSDVCSSDLRIDVERLELHGGELLHALAGERQHPVELVLVERLLLGGALNLDEAAVGGEHEIGVHLGAAVLDIVEVEQIGRASGRERGCQYV